MAVASYFFTLDTEAEHLSVAASGIEHLSTAITESKHLSMAKLTLASKKTDKAFMIDLLNWVLSTVKSQLAALA